MKITKQLFCKHDYSGPKPYIKYNNDETSIIHPAYYYRTCRKCGKKKRIKI